MQVISQTQSHLHRILYTVTPVGYYILVINNSPVLSQENRNLILHQ